MLAVDFRAHYHPRWTEQTLAQNRLNIIIDDLDQQDEILAAQRPYLSRTHSIPTARVRDNFGYMVVPCDLGLTLSKESVRREFIAKPVITGRAALSFSPVGIKLEGVVFSRPVPPTPKPTPEPTQPTQPTPPPRSNSICTFLRALLCCCRRTHVA